MSMSLPEEQIVARELLTLSAHWSFGLERCSVFGRLKSNTEVGWPSRLLLTVGDQGQEIGLNVFGRIVMILLAITLSSVWSSLTFRVGCVGST